jgi:hypothetical protein
MSASIITHEKGAPMTGEKYIGLDVHQSISIAVRDAEAVMKY